jgi:sigma-B regulation protein RsbU (phosphoserine phosphatase)
VTLQRRLQLLIAGVSAVLLVVVVNMGITLERFQHDATSRDRLAARVAAENDNEAAARALAQAVAHGRHSRAAFINSVWIATVAALTLLILGAWLLRRWVVVPIGRLHADLDAVSEGDFNHAITPSGSQDIVDLGAAAERMRTRILRQREAVERADEAVDQDLPAVAALRELLAPASVSSVAGLDVAATLLPAEGVLAGDWYDVVRCGDKLFISIGDVCGHGATTGIAAVRTKFALLDAMHLGLAPDAALRLAAERFGESNDFVTCSVVELDPAAGTGRYANAGHPPGLIVDRRGATRVLDPTGPLIGPFPAEWSSREFALAPSETLVLYSDGLTEARNESGDELGSAPVVRALETNQGPASEVVEGILTVLFGHCPDGCVDDVTVVVARPTSA